MFKINSFITSKILPTILITLVLASVFSVNSFAVDVNTDGWLATEMQYNCTVVGSGGGTLNGTVTVVDNDVIGGVNCRSFSTPSYAGATNVILRAYKNRLLKANCEYNIEFGAYSSWSSRSTLQVRIDYIVNGVVEKQQLLYNATPMATANNEWVFLDFNFVPDVSDLTGGYTSDIYIIFGENTTYASTFAITEHVYLENLDDNTTLFGSILAWLSRIYHSIVGGTDLDGVNHSGLVAGIVSGLQSLGTSISNNLSTLGNNLNTWLTGVKDGITNKLESVKTSIQNSIDNIQNWFVSLGDRISDFFTMLKNYLLYFRHPVTLNADGVPVDSNGNLVYTNPFTNTLNSLSDTLNDTFDDLDGFILTIQSVNVQISGYLHTFTTIFNRFNAAFPIFSIIIALAFIIIVIKKIMGR